MLRKYYKLLVIILGFIFITSLTIGYAILHEELNVQSRVALRVDKVIRIDMINNYSPINGASEIYNARYNQTDLIISINLPNLDSEITYDVLIKNSSNKTMQITDILNDTYSNNNINYTIMGLEIESLVNSNSSLNFSITFKYNSDIEVIPSDTSLGAVIRFVFEEYTATNYSYVDAGMILDLRGIQGPNNNVWHDQVNSQAMHLTNVSYDPILKNYSFDNTSYGTLNYPVIPETGDFTLEVFLATPAVFATGADEAIISQVSDTENDIGRFKLNLKHIGSGYELLAFANSTVLNSNVTYTYTTNPNPSTNYLLQLVRNNERLELYLNGVLVSRNNSFSTLNTISQGPFKIGKWNSKSFQPYTGAIYAIRVYNRALSSLELNNNMQVDYQLYQTEEVIDNLREFVINNHLVTSSNGLYLTSDNRYIYKGMGGLNNYVRFENDNRIYRIISLESDNTMRLVNLTYEYNIPFDVTDNRSSITSPYCTNASSFIDGSTTIKYGCNLWNRKTDLTINDSSILTFLNNDFYDSLNESVKARIVDHIFYSGFVSLSVSYQTAIDAVKSETWYGKIGLMDIKDVLDASLTNTNIGSANTTVTNYLTSNSSSSRFIWTMTGSNSNTWDVWTIANGSIGKRRASRYNQVITTTLTANYYALPVFHVNSNISVTGNGSLSMPFIISNN